MESRTRRRAIALQLDVEGNLGVSGEVPVLNLYRTGFPRCFNRAARPIYGRDGPTVAGDGAPETAQKEERCPQEL